MHLLQHDPWILPLMHSTSTKDWEDVLYAGPLWNSHLQYLMGAAESTESLLKYACPEIISRTKHAKSSVSITLSKDVIDVDFVPHWNLKDKRENLGMERAVLQNGIHVIIREGHLQSLFTSSDSCGLRAKSAPPRVRIRMFCKNKATQQWVAYGKTSWQYCEATQNPVSDWDEHAFLCMSTITERDHRTFASFELRLVAQMDIVGGSRRTLGHMTVDLSPYDENGKLCSSWQRHSKPLIPEPGCDCSEYSVLEFDVIIYPPRCAPPLGGFGLGQHPHGDVACRLLQRGIGLSDIASKFVAQAGEADALGKLVFICNGCRESPSCDSLARGSWSFKTPLQPSATFSGLTSQPSPVHNPKYTTQEAKRSTLSRVTSALISGREGEAEAFADINAKIRSFSYIYPDPDMEEDQIKRRICQEWLDGPNPEHHQLARLFTHGGFLYFNQNGDAVLVNNLDSNREWPGSSFSNACTEGGRACSCQDTLSALPLSTALYEVSGDSLQSTFRESFRDVSRTSSVDINVENCALTLSRTCSVGGAEHLDLGLRSRLTHEPRGIWTGLGLSKIGWIPSDELVGGNVFHYGGFLLQFADGSPACAIAVSRRSESASTGLEQRAAMLDEIARHHATCSGRRDSWLTTSMFTEDDGGQPSSPKNHETQIDDDGGQPSSPNDHETQIDNGEADRWVDHSADLAVPESKQKDYHMH